MGPESRRTRFSSRYACQVLPKKITLSLAARTFLMLASSACMAEGESKLSDASVNETMLSSWLMRARIMLRCVWGGDRKGWAGEAGESGALHVQVKVEVAQLNGRLCPTEEMESKRARRTKQS